MTILGLISCQLKIKTRTRSIHKTQDFESSMKQTQTELQLMKDELQSNSLERMET